MSMSTHLAGFKPADAKFKAMLAAWDACIAANVSPPEEVTGYFRTEERSEVDEAGVRVAMTRLGSGREMAGVAAYHGEMEDGFEVDLRELDPDIKILRFYNSY